MDKCSQLSTYQNEQTGTKCQPAETLYTPLGPQLRRELNEEQLSTATNNERISSNSQLLSFSTIIKRLQDLKLPKMATTSSSKQMEVNPRGIPRAPFVVSQDFKVQGSYLELLADKCIGRTMLMSTWVVRMRKSKLPLRSSRKPPRMWFCKSDLTTSH